MVASKVPTKLASSAPEGGEEQQETLSHRLINFFCAFGQGRSQSGDSHAVMQQFSLREGQRKACCLQILPFLDFMLKFLPLDRCFEQRHCVLKANVKKGLPFIMKEHYSIV